MSEPREDVLDKLDALLKKHVASEPDIPVLTDILGPPLVDLDIIPVLTEEIDLASPALPATPIELDLVHKPVPDDPAQQYAETAAMLARLEAVEAEVQADVEARIAKVQAAPGQTPSIEIPQHARYVALPLTPAAEPTSAPSLLPDETVKKIAALIEADVARILKTSLHQTLSEELSGMLNSSLDKAVSSMLDQFMIHIEDVVRTSIADELQKQLAPFKRPAPTNNS
jgi:hypothetical protein